MAKATKTRTCKKGYTCGGGCISRTKVCRSNLGPDGQKVVESYADFVKRVAAAESPAGQSPEPQPEVEATLESPSPTVDGLNELGATIDADTLAEIQANPEAAQALPAQATLESTTPQPEAPPADLKTQLKDLQAKYKKTLSKQSSDLLSGKTRSAVEAQWRKDRKQAGDRDWEALGGDHAWGAGLKGRNQGPPSPDAVAKKLKEEGIAGDLTNKQVQDGVRAIDFFTRDGYMDMRDEEKLPPDQRDATLGAQIDQANQLLDQLPAAEQPVYRGMRFYSDQEASDFLRQLDTGELETPAMSSYSTSEGTAAFAYTRMLSDDPDKAKLRVLIKVANNKSAKAVAPMSAVSDEMEAIVPKGVKHRVKGLGYRPQTKTMYIEMEEV